jgi:hypothetical protein
MSAKRVLVRENLRTARRRWGANLSYEREVGLRTYSGQLRMSVERGDIILIEGKWYVTHSGLLHLANRRHCCGIDVEAMPDLSDASASRLVFKAIVYKSSACKGFVGHRDANPSNVVFCRTWCRNTRRRNTRG